jgi:hypothetical protein
VIKQGNQSLFSDVIKEDEKRGCRIVLRKKTGVREVKTTPPLVRNVPKK